MSEQHKQQFWLEEGFFLPPFFKVEYLKIEA
jgi:hypothetical protein